MQMHGLEPRGTTVYDMPVQHVVKQCLAIVTSVDHARHRPTQLLHLCQHHALPFAQSVRLATARGDTSEHQPPARAAGACH